jgi:starch phosphorylase
MPTITPFTVAPRLPERLQPLAAIAKNLWWCWNPDATSLFVRIDPDLWSTVRHNPVRLLGMASQARLEELSQDDSFLTQMDRVAADLAAYLKRNHWREKNDAPEDLRIAYFSAEFGIHESISIYSGGLGLLAGDHLKSASDLGLPLVAIGLMYREGYFSQYLNADGWQQERYPQNDFFNMPLDLMVDTEGHPILVKVPFPGREVHAQIWRCQVGRVPLYLLDSDVESNAPDDRAITAKLYGGDHDTRVRQEVLLGMGGVLALRALGIEPSVMHANEGHAAFLALQAIKDRMLRDKLGFNEALEAVRASVVFTTHTPVPAGNDAFDAALMHKYFAHYCEETGISADRFMALGRIEPHNLHEPFGMTVLALRTAAGANGVSKLHGEVARSMWKNLWPGLPENEVPITSITNGVHTRTWLSDELAQLYDRYLGPSWIAQPHDHTIWRRINSLPDTELWRTHERARERLIHFARKRLYEQYKQRGAPSSELNVCLEVLDPEALTIGFARRFATYKRATLLLRDKERLKRILLNPAMPVQLIIAGKAHPADTAGKHMIRDLFHFARDPEVRYRVIFLEDYEINVARHMIQGVDCWLNTPRRPMEASGTSGMKAAANGALNISIPDGWWCEAEGLGPNGWSIGRGESYASAEEQDHIESQALYEILEEEAAPLFYRRGTDKVPREWIARMKCAICTIVPLFNTNRMVQEYTNRFYLPCARRAALLHKEKDQRARDLAAWKAHVTAAWPTLRILRVDTPPRGAFSVGDTVTVDTLIDLGNLRPEELTVEVYWGDLDSAGHLSNVEVEEMSLAGNPEDGVYPYTGTLRCHRTGRQGFAVRVLPRHPDLFHKHETGLIAWA